LPVHGDRVEQAISFILEPDCKVKESLTVDHIVRLLCIGAQRTLSAVRSVQLNEYAHMSNIYYSRVTQGLLAVAATSATVLVLQLAMLA
jgi:hypothetical protein